MPTTYDAALEPSNEVRNARGELRTSLDLDDFSSGFGVWSGTSFAAPVFAGQLAARWSREHATRNVATWWRCASLRSDARPARTRHARDAGTRRRARK